MHNECYEVVAVVLPEEAADQGATLPHTVLVRLYEEGCLSDLDQVIQNFVKAEHPQSHYHTIPVGSCEDFIEYWIEFPYDATEIAGKLRERLSAVYTRSSQAQPATAPDATRRRPDGLAA